MALETGRSSKSGRSSLLSLAATLMVAGIALPPAYAADLGGNCCADLEERVAELEATTARKGNRKVSLTISGQVTTGIMVWDDGVSDDVYVVDNVMGGGTQFQFAGNARVNPNLTAGFQLAFGMDVGSRGHQVSAEDDDGAIEGRGGGDTDMIISLANWYLDHKQLGRLTVGRANTATAGLTTIDLGGAGVIANASIGYAQRGFKAPGTGGSTWANLLGGNTVNGASLARSNAIVYTSPTLGGFSASGAWGENDLWDVALRYAGELSGFRVAAGIGYTNNVSGLGEIQEDRGDDACDGKSDECEPTQIKGSASILHVASGLYLTGAYVNQDNDLAHRPDTTLWYVQGGISKNWTGLGNTVLYGEYANVEDGLANFALTGGTSDADMWGLGVVQHIDAAAMELYLAYKQFGADSSKGDAEDFSVIMSGARIRF